MAELLQWFYTSYLNILLFRLQKREPTSSSPFGRGTTFISRWCQKILAVSLSIWIGSNAHSFNQHLLPEECHAVCDLGLDSLGQLLWPGRRQDARFWGWGSGCSSSLPLTTWLHKWESVRVVRATSTVSILESVSFVTSRVTNETNYGISSVGNSLGRLNDYGHRCSEIRRW